MSFNIRKRRFIYSFIPDEKISAPTEIYVPRYHYPRGFDVELSSGACSRKEVEQTLMITAAKGDAVTVIITARR
jgi:hypothetical protein